MVTLKDKEINISAYFVNKDNINFKEKGERWILCGNKSFYSEDVKEYLTKFYESYWKESKLMDKNKSHISCDELDYLMDKYFGSLVKIESLQYLENQEK